MAEKWTVSDLSTAMEHSVRNQADERFIKSSYNKLNFNGFWRNGNKTNVCIWLDSATWADAKTGEGGNCKDFAKTVFKMSLPEFMRHFGKTSTSDKSFSGKINLSRKHKVNNFSTPINLIWSGISNKVIGDCGAIKWLRDDRGFKKIRSFVGSGFISLNENLIYYFEDHYHQFLKNRLLVGKQLMVPLRSTRSDDVKNIFFRSITPCCKDEKVRLLPNASGWSEPDGTPRAFGFPHLIDNFPNLVLCEGMADYFAAECLLEDNEKYLPIGVANADAFIKWAKFLINIKYSGYVIIVYHLDKNENGNLSRKAIGPLKAVLALAELKKAGLNASLFDWSTYIENITTHPEEIHDLADSLKIESTYQECGSGHLQFLFTALLQQRERQHE